MSGIGSRLAALCLVAGCAAGPEVTPVAAPPERPAAPAPAPVDPTPAALPAPDDTDLARAAAEARESAGLADYYARVERSLLRQGLLRRDGGGPDTPYDADRLARTFMELAFYEEYDPSEDRLVARRTASQLHRFEAPVQIEARFGDSVGDTDRISDRNTVGSFARRLSRVTGHPIRTVGRGGNFTIFFVNEAERRAMGPELRRLIPGISQGAVNSIVNLPRSSYCIALAIDPGNNGTYSRAIAIVRSEHPDLIKLSCIHEELAQGLGLANDSPLARPSIFNDDEEFALLTTFDEMMLRMLYDPRLTPGMTAAEAEPIVRRMAAEFVQDPVVRRAALGG